MEADVGIAEPRRRDVEPPGDPPAVRAEQDIGALAQHLAPLPVDDLRGDHGIGHRLAMAQPKIFGGMRAQRRVDPARDPRIGDAEPDHPDQRHHHGKGQPDLDRQPPQAMRTPPPSPTGEPHDQAHRSERRV
ncbi:hypothetical protein WR25_25785 [Diploscapter pachys]|uniref:Uncharacterized protein n=1 Tax=Diploscapter pachys TaxID=2018661 RepID=A0A2A2M3E8_9BILA|nr:hypothetical protein WR25_25785 [Diploscapter pachys]